MTAAAVNAQPLLIVVQMLKPLRSRMSTESIDPGQIPMKKTVKRTAAVYAVNFAVRNFLMTISRGGRSWKFSPSSRLSSPLYLVTQGERGLSMSLVLSHSSSSISEVNLHRVMKVTMTQAAPPTEIATMLPVSIGSSSPVFLTKVAAERPPGNCDAYESQAAIPDRQPPTTPLTRP